MPTLLNVLSSNDPKVVEQGCLCVSRIVESFKYKPEKLEELIEPGMLRAVLRLLLPGTTNLIGPHIHTQFLRVLAITAKASPRLSVELLKMDVVDTVYQILTGVSPPENVENTSVKMDSVLVMQALIHRPKEQVFETLNVICELLPGVPARDGSSADSCTVGSYVDHITTGGPKGVKAVESAEKRRSLLMDCKAELKRFAMILLPTLTDAYSSTVNLGVRQKVLTAQLKLLYNLEVPTIEDALRSVPYASFLAAILSQKDHPTLVSSALRCAELLFQRLEHVYQYQFHREGVISEVVKLAEGTLSKEGSESPENSQEIKPPTDQHTGRGVNTGDGDPDESEGQDDDDDPDDEDDENDMSESETSSLSHHHFATKLDTAMKDAVIQDARAFLQVYEASQGRNLRDKASEILDQLQALAADIEACYYGDGDGDGFPLFKKLASYFGGDALESITSSELLNSGIIKVLLDVFDGDRCKLLSIPVVVYPVC